MVSANITQLWTARRVEAIGLVPLTDHGQDADIAAVLHGLLHRDPFQRLQPARVRRELPRVAPKGHAGREPFHGTGGCSARVMQSPTIAEA